MNVVERNVQEIGKSLLVTLPKQWATALKVKKGSKLKLLVSEQGSLSIAPEFIVQEKKTEIDMPFDEHFNRRFFREYFGGNEKITIQFKAQISEKERILVYAFLKNFMNVQIIEEGEKKIAVKCFRINELSVEECLQRMYFLSVNMLDERINGNDSLKLSEMQATMIRFYYMLVMQVRRFLSEGIFTTDKKMTIIRAMDMRMAAEKIERIGEIIKENGSAIGSEALNSLKKYYSTAVQCFISENFEKALPLMNEEKNLEARYQKLKDGKKKQSILQLLRYAKQISMLIR